MTNMLRLINTQQYNRILFFVLAILAGLSIAVSGLFIPMKYVLVLAILLPVLALLVIEPEWALILLVFIIYLNLSYVFVNYHGLPSIAKVFVPLVFLLGLRKVLWKGHLPDGFKSAIPVLMVFYFVMLLSILYAVNLDATIYKLEDYLKDMIIALAITLTLHRGSTLKRVIWSVVLAGGFLGAISVFQYLTGSFDNSYFGFGQGVLAHIVGESSDWRIGGPIGSPNAFGHLLLLVVPLALDRFLHEKNLVLRGVGGVCLGFIILTIIFTFSRSVFLGLIIIAALMIILKPPKPLAIMGYVAIFFVIMPFVPSTYVERVSTLTVSLGSRSPVQETSFRGRISEGTVAWQIFQDNPLLGVGINNYSEYYLQYSSQLGLDQRRVARTPHNRYLQILSEQGIIGLIAFLLLNSYVIMHIWAARKQFLHMNLNEYADIALAIMVGFMAYLAIYMFIDDTHPRYYWLFVGIAFALLNVARSETTQKKIGQ